ncbi:hypothetical protein GCM10029976_029150 [Kribbella albertanoniae]|uniref:DUF998 domain-containing protein n=1 Tax=Kribbella albertanoniae TaxID=1266829 RepID=A0A4R4P3A1_9ACTN|nr:DUF998 domain-containing protein [Kribbella albertanoniae]TDC15107.1 DUF998 domain-containing protein [Kribbella albertanoniae]
MGSIKTTVAALALSVAAIQYVVLEAVTAAAWENPAYSYAHNNISDLGVPSCGGEMGGRLICSPLHTLMNTSFIVQGLLFGLAAVLLYRLLPGRRPWIYAVLGLVHALGFLLVGLFHGSPEAAGADGGLIVHIFGAALLIVGGNAASIVVGHRLRATHPRWGIAGIALGLLGLLSLAVMGAVGGSTIASAFERGSVYPIIAAEFIAGIALLVSQRSAPAPVLPDAAPERHGV